MLTRDYGAQHQLKSGIRKGKTKEWNKRKSSSSQTQLRNELNMRVSAVFFPAALFLAPPHSSLPLHPHVKRPSPSRSFHAFWFASLGVFLMI